MQWLEAKGDPLSRLDTVIDWEGFRPLLMQALCRNGQGMRHSGSHHPTFHIAANLPPTHLGRSHSRTMKPSLTLLTALLLAPLAALHAADSPASKDIPPNRQTGQLMQDSSFEACPSGMLARTTCNVAWEVQRTGREAIRDRLVVACVEDAARARSGRICLSLSIPKATVGFEFVTVGQRLRLAAGNQYEASIWVRWVGGPDHPPAGAGATPGHRSAIVSFWARHRDGKGAFAGRDEWLFDNRWHKLSFRFCATDPDLRTLVYVSLLPNQQPVDTTVLLDDFELATMDGAVETESRRGNLVEDSAFEAQQAGGIVAPWSFANMGGTSIVASIGSGDGQRWLTLQMPRGTSNFESAQI